MEPVSPENKRGLNPFSKLMNWRKKPPVQPKPEIPLDITGDDPKNRALRVENQQQFEQDIGKTFGLPFVDRLALTRKGLFTRLENIAGYETEGFRSMDLRRILMSNYASGKFVAERFVPQMAHLVDNLYEEIKESNEDRTGKALRLASLIYTLGTPLHPYNDGNGQTLRLVALSYLKELNPEVFSEQEFPFKPLPGGEKNSPTTPILRPFTQLNAGALSNSQTTKEFALRTGAITEWGKGVRSTTEEEMNAMFPTQVAKDTAKSDFERRKKLEQQRFRELSGSHPTSTNLNAFIDFMLNSNEGKEFLTAYVTNRESLGHDPKNTPRYLNAMLEMLDGVNGEIKDILEPEDVHRQRFEEARKIALEGKDTQA